ncbi:MAG: PKD domain-containing protein [Cyclobacteriaceae bacterium]|nr:PKD domain-containing protein [Cyclobacteriaceae bacterium]
MKPIKDSLSVILKLIVLVQFGLFIGCNKTENPETSSVTADAGADQSISLGETVSLSGTGSDSAGGQVFYLWELKETPTSSFAFILNPITAQTSFTPDVEGSYVAQLTVTNEDGTFATDDVTIMVEQGDEPTEIGGSITTDTHLINIFDDPTVPDYIASSNVNVSAELTIDPEVLIVFEENTGMIINTGGTLIAVGTASEPIVFSGTQKLNGYWKGIAVESNKTSNELTHTIVEYGGSEGFDGANLKTNIMVQEAGRLKITNTISKNSGGYGLYTRDLDTTLPDFANNSFNSNKAPVMTRINHYHYFDAASDYTGNTNDYIDSYWSDLSVTENVTWKKLNVPYKLAGNPEDIESDVTIEAGVELIGQPASGLRILSTGSLNAVGTSTDNIIFRGEEDIAGYWKGLTFFSNTTKNELTYVVISNGGEEGFDGANIKTNIMVDDAGRLKITNTTSKKSGGFGLYTRDLESALPDFANNTFTENVTPVMTRINHYHYFDSNSDFTGNTNDFIDSYWSNQDVTLNATWQALNVPYKMAPNIETVQSNITINAGARFIGQPSGGLQFDATGTIRAEGELGNEIIFEGEENVQGYWKGLRIQSNSASNIMTYVWIKNGGEEGFDGANRKANIELEGTLDISGCFLANSGGAGIRARSGATLNASGNTYSSNLEGNEIIE